MSYGVLTLGEMAEALAAEGAAGSVDTLMRQIRHWTNVGLLRTIGPARSGTGVPRRYEFLELEKAALLNEFACYGLTVGQLSGFDVWVYSLANDERWEAARAGGRVVFVEMARYEGGAVSWWIGYDRPLSRTVERLTPPLKRGPDDKGELMAEKFRSAVVLNLTDIIAPLQKYAGEE